MLSRQVLLLLEPLVSPLLNFLIIDLCIFNGSKLQNRLSSLYILCTSVISNFFSFFIVVGYAVYVSFFQCHEC
jgi:hypothetical protein